MERKILNSGLNLLQSSVHCDLKQEMPTRIKFPFATVIDLCQSSDVMCGRICHFLRAIWPLYYFVQVLDKQNCLLCPEAHNETGDDTQL
jgi:hypothetical protein